METMVQPNAGSYEAPRVFDTNQRHSQARPTRAVVESFYESTFAARYDRLAEVWDRTLGWRAEAQFQAQLATFADRSLHVLDLGCGSGRNLDRLARAGVRVRSYRGIDGSRTMLRNATRRHRDEFVRFDHVPDLETIDTLPVVDGGYDLVLCTWVLSHLRNPARLLARARHAASTDGRVLIATLTDTNEPFGALGARRYERRLHAKPIPPELLVAQDPVYLSSHLFGLATVAGFRGSPRSSL